MARTVCYRLYSSTLAAGVQNAATITVPAAGRITAVQIEIVGSGGAAVGFNGYEVTKNVPAGGASGLLGTNNPQREALIAQVGIAWAITTPAFLNHLVDNISIPISVGDVLNFGSLLMFGTAPGQNIGWANLYVVES